MRFLFPPTDYRHFYGLQQTPPWYILSPKNDIKIHDANKSQCFPRVIFICLICAGTSGRRAVIKVLCSSSSLFTMLVRHFSLGCEEPFQKTEMPSDKAANQSRCSHLTSARCHSSQRGVLTLFAGEEAFLRVSSSMTFSVSRFETTNDRHSSRSPPHISSSTRYAFFCMPGSLVLNRTWSQLKISGFKSYEDVFLTSKYGLISSKVLVRATSST